MPAPDRCPSCGAALAPTAAWCSLCHADLRPAPLAAATVGAAVDVVPGTAAATAAAPAPAEAPRGRHSRPDTAEAPAPAPRRSSGRHAAGARRAPAEEPPALDLPDEDLPAAEVDAIADQMLGRLAVTEKRPHLLDPHDLPGGKPVFVVAVAVLVTLGLLALATVLGLLFVR